MQNTPLLDRLGDASPPQGYRVVATEIDFLRAVMEPQPLLVRGALLCDWAERFYRGRGIATQRAYSLRQSLGTLYPDVDEGALQALRHLLPPQFEDVRHSLSTAGILNALHPLRLWSDSPGAEHAAQWLLWLVEEQPHPALQPVLHNQASQWQTKMSGALKDAYGATDAETASALLQEWLHIIPPTQLWPPLPQPTTVPESLRAWAETQWRRALIQSKGAFWLELNRRPLAPELQKLAALEAAGYFSKNRELLTRDLYATLQPHLTRQQQREFEGSLPPPSLAPFPAQPQDVLAWVVESYLPNRRWAMAYSDKAMQKELDGAARQFAEWYLQAYASALVGGALRGHLAFDWVHQLAQQAEKAVTLVVVLDGPYLEDGIGLLQQVRQMAPRLTLLREEYAFAPIPSITAFCKPSLWQGLPPALAKQDGQPDIVVKPTQSPRAKLEEAAPATVLFWNQIEPDATYHGRTNNDQLLHEVEGQLNSLASKLAQVIQEVPPSVGLRVILTADHGRLYGSASRTHPVPSMMEAHGRAAWGRTAHNFPESGYLIEGDIAYLDGQRFGTGPDLAIVLSSDAFEGNDGRTGQPRAPHGGLFPEEMVVPWFVLARDFSLPMVEITLAGTAIAGRAGTLQMSVLNGGENPLTVERLLIEWQGDRADVAVNGSVSPRNKEEFKVEIPTWPPLPAAQGARATASIRLESGHSFAVPCEVAMESRAMYQRADDDLLGDLEL